MIYKCKKSIKTHTMSTKKYTKEPFNYEYFKSNPNTELETRDGEAVRFIGESVLYNRFDFKLVFDSETGIITTSINGKYHEYVSNKRDIFMLIEVKEIVGYFNICNNWISLSYNTLNSAIANHIKDAKSVAKITFVNGKMTGFETVYVY